MNKKIIETFLKYKHSTKQTTRTSNKLQHCNNRISKRFIKFF